MIGSKFPLRPGELMMLVVILVSATLITVVTLVDRPQLVWRGFALQAALILTLGSIGGVYRILRRDERIATATISTALLLAVATSLATYNYLLLPVSRPLIDPWLAQTNALLGFRWSDWVEWLIGYPWLARALGWIYASSMAQIAILVLSLSFCQRWRSLDRMLITLVLCSVATVTFWAVFPSISISAFETISAEAARVVAPAVGVEAGAELLRLVRHGPGPISPETMTGLIGFPSFHTILALLCIRFGWDLPRLRAPFLAINIAMMPAILVHGSHYVIDLVGAAAFFLGGLAIADRLLAGLEAPAASSGHRIARGTGA